MFAVYLCSILKRVQYAFTLYFSVFSIFTVCFAVYLYCIQTRLTEGLCTTPCLERLLRKMLCNTPCLELRERVRLAVHLLAYVRNDFQGVSHVLRGRSHWEQVRSTIFSMFAFVAERAKYI